jgi:ABC-type transporter Mla subunit MlaD
MIDPNFDPLQELRQTQRDARQAINNTLELAKAFNNLEGLMAELTAQHNQLCTVLRQQRKEIDQLKKHASNKNN